MVLFCAAIRRESVSLLGFPFLNKVQFLSSEISFVCHLKCPESGFPSHFGFLVIFVQFMLVLSAFFSGGCNQLSFVLVYAKFLSMYWCVNAVHNAGTSYSTILKHAVCLCHVWEIRLYASPWVFLFSDPFVEVLWSNLKMVPNIQRGGSPNIYFFDEISAM